MRCIIAKHMIYCKQSSKKTIFRKIQEETMSKKLKVLKKEALTNSETYFCDTKKQTFIADGQEFKITSAISVFSMPDGKKSGVYFNIDSVESYGEIRQEHFKFGGNNNNFIIKTKEKTEADCILTVVEFEHKKKSVMYGLLVIYTFMDETVRTGVVPIPEKSSLEAVLSMLRNFYHSTTPSYLTFLGENTLIETNDDDDNGVINIIINE